MLLGVGIGIVIVPMAALGLASYPTFLHLRQRALPADSSVARDGVGRGLAWFAIPLALALILVAISPRLSDDGLSGFHGEEREIAQHGLAAAYAALHHLMERDVLVQRPKVIGIQRLSNNGRGDPATTRHMIGLVIVYD